MTTWHHHVDALDEGGIMRRERLPELILMMVLGALIFGAQSVCAQLRIVGSISGTVQDPTGAVVPKAHVVLKDTKTGITRETTSTEAGTFLFPDLAVGIYEVTVTAPGFKSETLNNVSVSTSQTTDVRVNLELG